MTPPPVWTHSCRQPDQQVYSPQGDIEAERAARLIDMETAQNFLHARDLTRRLVAREAGLNPEAVTLRAYDDARSSIQGLESIGVSWSRSGPHALAALVREGRIGADIEQLQPLNTRPVLQMISTEAERDILGTLEGEDALKGFYRLWCAKEAVLKWRGKGLRGGPKSVIVADEFIAGQSLDIEMTDKNSTVRLLAVEPSPDCVGVLAFSG